METQMTTLSAGILLFLILDPLGNIPFFLSLLKHVPPQRRRWVMMRELLIALAVLIAFLLGGQVILHSLQLKQESVSIGGGILLFLIGIKMVFPPLDGGIFGPVGQGGPFIVPRAIPRVAGPRRWPRCCCSPIRSRDTPRNGALRCSPRGWRPR